MIEKMLKKALYTGVGMVAATTERLQKVVDDLVERGKISEDEGKKVVDDVVKNTEHKREEYESRFRKLIDATLSKINLPQGDSYDKLEKRVKSLEVKLGLLIKELEAQRKGTAANLETALSNKKSKKTSTVTESEEV